MEATLPTLVLTRPLPAAHRFARAARAALWTGPILFAPVLEIVPVDGARLPDGMLVFTSENGVQAAAALNSLAGRQAVAVGDHTARVARDLGALCRSAGGTVEDLLALLSGPDMAAERLVHCHGRHVSGDLVERLAAAGIAARGAVLYDQVARPLSEAALRALKGPAPAVLPLFSARSARLVAEAAGPVPASTVAVALSAQIARCWPWEPPALIAAQPKAAALLDRVRGLVGRDGCG